VKHLLYVLKLVKFAFRANRLLYISLAISLFSVVIELLAMSSLLPLFQAVSGNVPETDSFIARFLVFFGYSTNAKTILWMFIILIAARIITQLAGQSLSYNLSRRVMAQLGAQAFEKIMHRLDIRDINKKSIGFYIGLAGDEAFRASTLVMSLTQFASTAILAILYFAAISHYSPITAGIILVFALSSLFALYKVTKVSHRLGGRQTEESRRARSVFLDSLNNLKAVRAFSAEKYVTGIYRSLIFGYARTLFLIDSITLSTKLIPVLLLLLLFSIWMIMSSPSIEGSNLAFITTMIVYLMRFFPTVGQGINLLMKIASDAKSGKDITEILGTEQSTEPVNPSQLKVIQSIDLRRMGFTYDDHAEKKLLVGLDLKFEKGKSYAVIGRSGAGKTTLVDLLMKFYLPTQGELLINGKIISEIEISEIRKRIIVVSQETAIFDDTVLNNIRMGMSATSEEVISACVSAEINDVIENMPHQYETRLQYQGKNLSGGQRQRIAIARALLRKPDMLILDESTSALDKETQRKVIDNILHVFEEKIVVFITHDPQIMDRVNEVIDMEVINKI